MALIYKNGTYYGAVPNPVDVIVSTDSGTAAKVGSYAYTVSANSYILVDLQKANSAANALTLKVGNMDAKPIYVNGAVSSSTNYTLPAGVYEVFYDGTNYYFRTDGKLTASITGDAGTVNGKTVEENVPSGAVFTDTTYTNATTADAGLMSASDKIKLDGIDAGAEANQDAFSNVKIGSTTVGANSTTATFELIAGSNVTLTPDATNSAVTIAATDTTYTNATTADAGLMSSSDKVKLDGIAAGAEVNQDAFANVKVGNVTVAANSTTAVLEVIAGSNVTVTPDATNDTITIAATDTTYTNATTADAGLMSASDKAKLDGIATGAEVNQDAFSNIKVGSSTLSSDSKTGTFELAAGSNVTITSNAGTRAAGNIVTISANDTTYNVVSASADGLAPQITNTSNYLKGDGTWSMPSAADVGALATSVKGAANGVAELDANGKVPSAQLPSYVDDIVEGYYNTTDGKFYEESTYTTEITPESGKIYVDLTSNKTYRWGGTEYVEISESLALGETDTTAYRGDRGKAAYDHSQLTSGNPHNVTKSDVGLSNVGNFKAVSTAANQGLSSTEQTNARANIGAGTSNFSGAYADLTGTPDINDGVLTITLNGTSKGTFSANQSNASTIALTDTTYSNATTAAAGLMSSADKTKLDGLSTTLGGLSDVTITSPSDKQVLQYSSASSAWINATELGNTTISLEDFNDLSQAEKDNGTAYYIPDGEAAIGFGIDNTPTENSSNLVTSGGIYSFVNTQVTAAIAQILSTSY